MSLYQILSKSVKRLQRYSSSTVFKNGGRPPSWICWASIGTTCADYLMVSIVVQNFVEMDAVAAHRRLVNVLTSNSAFFIFAVLVV